MTRSDLRARDLERLKGVHPECRSRVIRLLLAFDALGFPMTVTDALRTTEEQQRLYRQGRSAPGNIVTNADGVTKKSNHQAKEDGFGHAADLTFLDDALHPSWAEHWPWEAFGKCAQATGLKWGGAWTTPDRPHVEWI